MAFTQKRVYGPATLTASSASIYSPAVAGTTGIIKQIMLTNYTNASGTVDIWVVPATGSAENARLIFTAVAIAAYETIILNLSFVIEYGAAIHAKANAISKINITINGIEESA
jgi:hypothetical protein